MPIDLFISHASEDKDAVARPVAEELRRRGWRVWFDEFELTLGDSLRRKIDEGLVQARFGLVVLSPSFFAKEWPQRELDGLTARETVGRDKVILPVWHDVDAHQIARYSPPLADKLAVKSTAGTAAIVDEIERALGSAPSAGGVSPSTAVDPTHSPSPPASTPALDALARPVDGNLVLRLLIENNQVALREALRSSRRSLEERARKLAIEHQANESAFVEAVPTLSNAMAGLVDATVPLIRNGSPLAEEQARWLGRLAGTKFVDWGAAAWVELPLWMAWSVSHACGGYALCVDELPAVRAMLAAPVDYGIRGVAPAPLASISVGRAASAIDEETGGNWAAPWFENWCGALRASRALRMTAPEFFDGDEHAPRQWLLDYNLLTTLFSGTTGKLAASPWTAYTTGGLALTERMKRDEHFLDQVAGVLFQCSSDDFRANAARWLQEGLGGGRAPWASGPLLSRARLDF